MADDRLPARLTDHRPVQGPDGNYYCTLCVGARTVAGLEPWPCLKLLKMALAFVLHHLDEPDEIKQFTVAFVRQLRATPHVQEALLYAFKVRFAPYVAAQRALELTREKAARAKKAAEQITSNFWDRVRYRAEAMLTPRNGTQRVRGTVRFGEVYSRPGMGQPRERVGSR